MWLRKALRKPTVSGPMCLLLAVFVFGSTALEYRDYRALEARGVFATATVTYASGPFSHGGGLVRSTNYYYNRNVRECAL